MTTRIALVGGILVVVVALALALSPRAETQAERVSRLASELRCPVCQGLSVEESPSDTARQMRALVAQRVAEGRSDDDIHAEFRGSYGDWIFLSPPLADPRGLVWILPLVVIAAGAALVAWRMGRAPPLTAPSPQQLALLHERARADEVAE